MRMGVSAHSRVLGPGRDREGDEELSRPMTRLCRSEGRARAQTRATKMGWVICQHARVQRLVVKDHFAVGMALSASSMHTGVTASITGCGAATL
jgi:hypothetical protein